MDNPPIDRDHSSAGDDERRRVYHAAFRRFSRSLDPKVRERINGSGSPDWQSHRTFALPVKEESAAYCAAAGDGLAEALDELADAPGALVQIALWLADRTPVGASEMGRAGVGPSEAADGVDLFRLSLARICEAKNARLEAELIGLAVGLNLHGNANGYEMARRFGLTPQTIHERLGETCEALGLRKPLAKANKGRYAMTQHRHNLRGTAH